MNEWINRWASNTGEQPTPLEERLVAQPTIEPFDCEVITFDPSDWDGTDHPTFPADWKGRPLARAGETALGRWELVCGSRLDVFLNAATGKQDDVRRFQTAAAGQMSLLLTDTAVQVALTEGLVSSWGPIERDDPIALRIEWPLELISFVSMSKEHLTIGCVAANAAHNLANGAWPTELFVTSPHVAKDKYWDFKFRHDRKGLAHALLRATFAARPVEGGFLCERGTSCEQLIGQADQLLRSKQGGEVWLEAPAELSVDRQPWRGAEYMHV